MSADTGARERCLGSGMWPDGTRRVGVTTFAYCGVCGQRVKVVGHYLAVHEPGVGVSPDARRLIRLGNKLADAAERLERNPMANCLPRFRLPVEDAVAEWRALAGVGEARPAEPDDSLSGLRTAGAENLVAENRRLREQLDAARGKVAELASVLEHIASLGTDPHGYTFTQSAAVARAALGVVGPPAEGLAESAESADVRGGES